MLRTKNIHVVDPHRNRRLFWSALRYVILLIALLFFSFPVFWIASTSFKSAEEYQSNPPVYLPSDPSFVHYQRAWNGQKADKALRDSFIVAGGATFLTVLLGASASYSIARFNTGGQNFSFWILSQRMIPPVAIVLPVFLLYREVNLIDSYMGLILLYTVFNLPLGVWMLRSYIIEVPEEVEDSAMIDGASRFQVLRHITLPLAAAGMSATTAFVFIFSWTEFLFARVLIRNNVLTLPVLVAQFFTTQSNEWGVASAVSMIATLPVVILGLLIRRHFVRGLTMGAVKE
jgi:multiple sugar transport system permease protein